MIQSESVNKTKKPDLKLEIMLIHLVQGFPALSFEISSWWPLLLAPISFDSLLTSHFPLIDTARKERPLKSKHSCTYCVMATIHEHTYIYLDITLTPKAHYFLN